jgi:hypothetical protein
LLEVCDVMLDASNQVYQNSRTRPILPERDASGGCVEDKAKDRRL